MTLNNKQLTLLVTLRVIIGWHFLYEGLTKWLSPNWTSIGYLIDSKGFLSGFFSWMASSPTVVNAVDIMNIYGLMAIGLGLITGFLFRPALIGGITMLAFYYLSHPPLLQCNYMMPSEGSYYLVNKNLIELVTMAVLYIFPTSHIVGIDRFVFGLKE